MSRSLKKPLYVDPRVLKKVQGKNPKNTPPIKIWSRACVISPEMVGFTFLVHNGRKFVEVVVTEHMVGHRFGEFAPTKTFKMHGGKMMKELLAKKRQQDIEAARAAKAAAANK